MVQQDMVVKECCNMHMMSTHFRDNLQRSLFDWDSQPLMFDDGASTSITNDLQDFKTKPTPIMQKVKGIAGSVKVTYRRTVKWRIEDNNNIIHTYIIPNTYYIAAAQQESYHHNISLNRCKITSHMWKEWGAQLQA